MWPQLEFYVLHYASLVGLPGYCAVITVAVASWFTFYRDDRRTGFELLIASWLILCFGIAYGFWSSFMYFTVGGLIWGLHDVLVGAVVPFLLTIPAAAHL